MTPLQLCGSQTRSLRLSTSLFKRKRGRLRSKASCAAQSGAGRVAETAMSSAKPPRITQTESDLRNGSCQEVQHADLLGSSLSTTPA